MEKITEGKAQIQAYPGKVSKKLEVFYNPFMKHNRDISVLFLNAITKKKLRMADIMAASGIRSIRFLKELNPEIIDTIWINDYSQDAIDSITQNLKDNKIKEKFQVSCKDANEFLACSEGFHYIDIDPFGSPNPYLDSSIRRLGREGILAVTGTDTAPLSGTYPKACMRKYWAKPMRTEIMHEIGLRILIRKVQLIGAQYDKALIPQFSYSKDHYFRIFFQNFQGKTQVDEMLKQHGMNHEAGPLWLGQLWNPEVAEKMQEQNEFSDLEKFLSMIAKESKIKAVCFYDLHVLCKKHKVETIPKLDRFIEKINDAGFQASRTHFRDNSFRTTMPEDNIIKVLKKFSQKQ